MIYANLEPQPDFDSTTDVNVTSHLNWALEKKDTA